MAPKTTKVYDKVGARLAIGKHAPSGKLLSERTLVEELGIGRTALRQVLDCRVFEGHLKVQGRSSFRVPGGVSVQRPEGWNTGVSTASATCTATGG
ncbi:GntR family transcriptional regulator [Streptomyces smyrnaeus]